MYNPPESGRDAPSSAKVSAPSSDRMPPTVHTTSAIPPEPAFFTTPPGVRKMPEPITVPMTMKIRSRRDRVRRSCSVMAPIVALSGRPGSGFDVALDNHFSYI